MFPASTLHPVLWAHHFSNPTYDTISTYASRSFKNLFVIQILCDFLLTVYRPEMHYFYSTAFPPSPPLFLTLLLIHSLFPSPPHPLSSSLSFSSTHFLLQSNNGCIEVAKPRIGTGLDRYRPYLNHLSTSLLSVAIFIEMTRPQKGKDNNHTEKTGSKHHPSNIYW